MIGTFLKELWGSKKIGWRIARMVLLFVIGSWGVALLFENKFIFLPAKYPQGMWDVQNIHANKDQIVPKIEDCEFYTIDGVKLHGWFCTPHKNGAPVPADRVLLYFHGNAGNITNRYDKITYLMELPVKVFIIDYRGYGKSEGKPSEKGLYRDARAAWDYLVTQRDIRPNRIVIFGKSLGGAPAIDLAARVSPAGLVVQSTFTSIPDMAAAVMYVPRFLVSNKMDSINKIGFVSCPKLVIHSPADEVVPFEMGKRLFEAAREPKQFLEVPDCPHNETYVRAGKVYWDTMRQFITSCGR